MKRIITIICAIALISCFCACTESTGPSSKPGDAPVNTDGAEITEAPAVTDEPEVTEAPVVTDEPVVTSEPSVRVKLTHNEPYTCDIDFDGIEDTLLLELEEGEWDYTGKFTVTLGAEGSAPFECKIDYCIDSEAYIIDSDPSDNRLDILFWYVQESESYTSYVCRVNKDGSGIASEEGSFRFDISDPLTLPNAFTVFCESDILGTRSLKANAVAGENGMELITPYSYSESNEWYGKMTLKKDLTVTIVNSDGTLGEEVTVPVGTELMPLYTDMSTYADLSLPDGRTGRVSVTITTGDDWGICLNGENQDEFFDIMYAG
ncbi:MAG: hypothetical protein IKP26_05105 [Clostridia bacterium]|nr:hypothetical protein [Clostridia bacterium]MBR6108938.1 hypothetical protein [Clostridia bacterium]